MKQSLPTPVAAVVLIVVLVVMAFFGWRYLNPPPLTPVQGQGGGGVLQPAIPPVGQPSASERSQPTQAPVTAQ